MQLDEIKISRAIIDSNSLDVDVAVAGVGPAGTRCGYYLAKEL